MKDLYRLIIEELVPTKRNTYYDEFGLLRWMSNHHVVSEKYFQKIQNAMKTVGVKVSNSPMPSMFDLDENTVEMMCKIMQKNGGCIDPLLEDYDLVVECPFLKRLMELVGGKEIVDSDDAYDALEMYDERGDPDEEEYYDDEEMEELTALNKDVFNACVFNHLYRIKEIYKQARRLKISPRDMMEKVNGLLKELVAKDNVTINIRCDEDVLGDILSDGRFKTQFETQVSNGCLSYGVRNSVELVGQGYNTLKENQETRPIYGYATKAIHINPDEKEYKHRIITKSKDFDKRVKDPSKIYDVTKIFDDGAIQYGPCICVMKDYLRGRTTVTFGDSLNKRASSSPIGSPDILSGDLDDVLKGIHSKEEFEEMDAESLLGYLSEKNLKYIETQINGGVTSQDIDYVVINGYPDDESTENMLKLLDEYNIPYLNFY